ncbi:MAG: M67 family metallopeptidase [Pseudomonadota bacterium]
MRLEISRADVDRLLGEAATSPDGEVCGLLLGAGLRVDAVRACRNVAENPGRSFEIDPAALIAAYRAARNGGPGVIGHYHSHPTGTPEPSARDAAAAHGGEVWMIMAGGAIQAWLAARDGHFTRIDIHPSP